MNNMHVVWVITRIGGWKQVYNAVEAWGSNPNDFFFFYNLVLKLYFSLITSFYAQIDDQFIKNC
jgi:hypothetical protein